MLKTAIVSFLASVGLLVLFASSDLGDRFIPQGRELTYHYGPKLFVNVNYSYVQGEDVETVSIIELGRRTEYRLKASDGQLWLLTTETLGDGQAVSSYDDYKKVVPTKHQKYIDYVRANQRMVRWRQRVVGA